jgi:hypothetical protein
VCFRKSTRAVRDGVITIEPAHPSAQTFIVDIPKKEEVARLWLRTERKV